MHWGCLPLCSKWPARATEGARRSARNQRTGRCRGRRARPPASPHACCESGRRRTRWRRGRMAGTPRSASAATASLTTDPVVYRPQNGRLTEPRRAGSSAAACAPPDVANVGVERVNPLARWVRPRFGGRLSTDVGASTCSGAPGLGYERRRHLPSRRVAYHQGASHCANRHEPMTMPPSMPSTCPVT